MYEFFGRTAHGACAHQGRSALDAAIATETRFKGARLTGVYDRLRNDALSDVVRANLERFGAPRATTADRERSLRLGGSGDFDCRIHKDATGRGRGSSDEANVSWIAPLAVFNVVCYGKGTRGHHRDLANPAALPFALRGMIQAAKVFAGSAVDVCSQPAPIGKARAEFKRRTKGFHYDPLVSKNQKPPIDPP